MQIKSLFLGAAGIAAVTALSGCSTGSVKGEFDVPYALSTTIGVGGVNIAPTELEVEVNAKVNVGIDKSNGTPNASGKFKIEDENLDLEFEGKILYGIIESDETIADLGAVSVSSEVNSVLGANIIPAFESALGNNPGTIRGAAFLGELEGEDDDDDNDDDSNNASNGLFAVVLADFPTCDLSQTILGISKPVTKFVGFAAIDCDAQQGYIAAGFASKGKLKWNIVPAVTN
ncbi:MAG: hypothetical protein ACOYLC_03765 [Armatimonadaceae bacterium]